MNRRFGFALLTLGVVLSVSGPARAGVVSTYTIGVDTTSLLGRAGLIDFQFDPGNTPVDSATAYVEDFSCDCTLTGVLPPDFGDVSGSLPGTVTLDNTFQDNEHTEQVTFGSYFDFSVTLETPDVSGTAAGGTTFALSVWDTDFNPALTGDPLVTINLAATTGTPTVTNNSADEDATVEQQTVAEPSAAPVLAMLVLTLGWRHVRRPGRLPGNQGAWIRKCAGRRGELEQI